MSQKIPTLWDLYAAGLDAVLTAMRLGETMVAANSVVASRMATIDHATRNPLRGDYRELGRMVPEKIDAFTRAGRSLAKDADAIHAGLVAQAEHFARLGSGSRMPGPSDLMEMTARAMTIGLRVADAAGQALLPIHATATANAKRLRKKGRGKGRRG